MLKVKELSFVKELTQEEFIQELDRFSGKSIALSITGAILCK